MTDRTSQAIEAEIAAIGARKEALVAEQDAAQAAAQNAASNDALIAATERGGTLTASIRHLGSRLAALADELTTAQEAEAHASKVTRLKELASVASQERTDFEAAYIEGDRALQEAMARVVEHLANWTAARSEFIQLADELTARAMSNFWREYDPAKAANKQAKLDALMSELADADLSSALAVGLWHGQNPTVSFAYTHPPARFAAALDTARQLASGGFQSALMGLTAVLPTVTPATPLAAYVPRGGGIVERVMHEGQARRDAATSALPAL